MEICVNQLSKIQRSQNSDLTVLSFAREYLEKNQKKSQNLIQSISNILKELNQEFNYRQDYLVQM
jgi:hypothetical protein